MNHPSPQWLPYRELFGRASFNALRDTEVPGDHAISLGLPTRRWLGPGYAFFASPAVHRPRESTEQKAPDRWWVLDAGTGHLMIYARAAAVPFAHGPSWGTIRLPPAPAVEELRNDANRFKEVQAAHDRVAGLLDRLSPLFFLGEPGQAAERQSLAEAINAVVPEPLRPQYRALVPDFFAWLEA